MLDLRALSLIASIGNYDAEARGSIVVNADLIVTQFSWKLPI